MHLLIFGATGLCGRAVVQSAIQSIEVQTVTVFVRDESRAREMFSKYANAQQQPSTEIIYTAGDIYNASHVKNAMQNVDAIISCVASYTRPHTQISTLTQNVVDANASDSMEGNDDRKVLYIHFGFPRGLGPMGTFAENCILKLTKFVSRTKYRPAMKEHVRAKQTLEEYCGQSKGRELLDFSIFAAPTMVDKPGGKREYLGKGGSLGEAVKKSRVWHYISTHDAADLMLSHLSIAMNDSSRELPKLLCLSYI